MIKVNLRFDPQTSGIRGFGCDQQTYGYSFYAVIHHLAKETSKTCT